jgi:penicillin amidase
LLENPTSSATGLSLFDVAATASVVEAPEDILLRALRAGLDVLEGKLGSDPAEWQWGKIHMVQTQDLFGQFGAPQRTLGPFARPGGNFTVDVANAGRDAEGNYIYRAGPQMRFYAILDPDGIQSGSSLPGGQIDDPDDPHYDDLLPGWLNNEAFEYHFTDDDVVAHTEELIVLEPGD